MAISISRFSRTFLVSFFDAREMTLIAAVALEGRGADDSLLVSACSYSANRMPLYTVANDPDPNRSPNTYPAATLTLLLFAGPAVDMETD